MDIWFFIACVEFVIIGILVFMMKKNYKKDIMSITSTHSDKVVDFSNVFNVFNATAKYNELKIKCHPDLYPDALKSKLATELFQCLEEYRTNYSKLQEIEVRINNELLT